MYTYDKKKLGFFSLNSASLWRKIMFADGAKSLGEVQF